MEITTTPVCRVGWEGQTLTYVVKAQGASDVSVPENPFDGIQARIAEQHPVDGGVEARLVVEVTNSDAF